MFTDFKPLTFLACLLAALFFSLIFPTVALVFYAVMVVAACSASLNERPGAGVWMLNAAGMFAVATLRYLAHVMG